MKKIFAGAMMVLALSAVSCTKDLETKYSDLETRVTKLETDVAEAVKVLNEVTEKGYYVTGIQELSDGSGYTLSFSNGKMITVLNGKNGANGKDGKDGQNGQNGQDGAAGANGKDGDSYFQSVTVSETSVEIVLANGTKFTVPIEAAFALNISTDTQYISSSDQTVVEYTVTNATKNTTVDCLVSGNYRAEVAATDNGAGTLTISGSKDSDNGKVLVYADNGFGKTSIRTIALENGTTRIINAAAAVSGNGGKYSCVAISNVDYSVKVSAAWMKLDETKAFRRDTLTFSVEENPGDDVREATIQLMCGDVVAWEMTVAQEARHGIRNLDDFYELVKASNKYNAETGFDYSKLENAEGVIRIFNDLDFTAWSHYDGDEWWPISDDEAAIAATSTNIGGYGGFNSVLDGQNHKISNLKTNMSGWTKFSFITLLDDGGVVKNLTFDETCSMTATHGSAAGGSCYGAVVSVMNSGATLENVHYNGTVTVNRKGSAGFCSIGGLVGVVAAYKSNSTIKNCSFGGTLNATGVTGNTTTNSTRIGGIVGYATRPTYKGDYYPTSDEWRINITNCAVTGTLNYKGVRVGGILGEAAGGVVIDSCSVKTNVTNTWVNNNCGTTKYAVVRMGGILGYENGGYTVCDEIKNCTVEGIISDSMQGYVGGVVGMSRAIKVSDCQVNGTVASNYFGDKNPEKEETSIYYDRGLAFGYLATNTASPATSIVVSGVKAKGYVSKVVSDAGVVSDAVAATASDLVGAASDGVDVSGVTLAE